RSPPHPRRCAVSPAGRPRQLRDGRPVAARRTRCRQRGLPPSAALRHGFRRARRPRPARGRLPGIRTPAMNIETLAVHAGREPDPSTGALREPIHLATTFERGADGTYPHGYFYSRSGNPNRSALERAVAALEGGREAVAFASGSAATLAVFTLAAAGGRVVYS